MSLSPRIRADYLLLHPSPTSRQCLEAFATPEGVGFCAPFSNIVRKAANELPVLPDLLASLSPDFVSHRVCMALDGVQIEDPCNAPSLDGLFDE